MECALCPVPPSGNALENPSIIQYHNQDIDIDTTTDLVQISSVFTCTLVHRCVCRHVCTHVLIFS